MAAKSNYIWLSWYLEAETYLTSIGHLTIPQCFHIPATGLIGLLKFSNLYFKTLHDPQGHLNKICSKAD